MVGDLKPNKIKTATDDCWKWKWVCDCKSGFWR